MKKTYQLSLLAAISLLLLAFWVPTQDSKQDNKVVLTGKVLHIATQKGITKAYVMVHQIIDGPDAPLIDTAYTDQEGAFALEIPMGHTFKLSAEAPGMEGSSVFVSSENLDRRSFSAVIQRDIVLSPEDKRR